MNQAKFEKINGREALKRLLNGEKVYSCESERYRLDPNGNLYYIPNPTHHENLSFATIKEILSVNWYVPKPFDVRQAMFDRPNEWVAAYNDERGKWIQVGFDTVNMRPVKAYHGYTGGVEGANGDFPTGYELETCIPIEDVPEEATR